MVKNVLGETVNIIGSYDGSRRPDGEDGRERVHGGLDRGRNHDRHAWRSGTTPPASPLDPRFRSGSSHSTTEAARPDRTRARRSARSRANKPTLDASGNCTVGTCELSNAQNLFERYADQVNWGMLYFWDTNQTQAVQIDTTGGNVNLQSLKDYYRAVGDTGPSGVTPLNPSGGTGTIAALSKAKTMINTAITGDTKLRGSFRCDRPYGVVLVTDGLSNTGNPNNGNWISPCGIDDPDDLRRRVLGLRLSEQLDQVRGAAGGRPLHDTKTTSSGRAARSMSPSGPGRSA